MLSFLRIRNFALVEDLEIEFGPGFNAITGETGAGKSLLIGALNLLLGERAEKNAVRTGADEAVVEAVLIPPSGDGVRSVLAESGLDACEENRLLVRRIVPRTGAGRNLVNGGMAPLSVFKRLGECLVDLHGPHEHQSLFRESPRIAMLDAFGATGADRDAYAAVYRDLQDLLARREGLVGSDDGAAAQMELLDFQVGELEEARLDPDEETELSAEIATVANALRIRELSVGLEEALVGEEGSAFRAVADSQRMLTELERIFPDAEAWGNDVRSLAAQIRAVAGDIAAATAAIEDNPERLQWLENRMALYFRLKRKYGTSVPELVQRLERWREQLKQWRGRHESLQKLDRQIDERKQHLAVLGQKLSARRRAAAVKMAAAVIRQLADLGLAQGEFRVGVEPAAARAAGMDRVDYAFTPNLGEPMAPLQAIASSGEISRVMLAVKAVLAEHDSIPVLVFDEIDANLGGEAGHAVGHKLAELARHRQVICITHLAQVAAGANTHFAVSKETHAGRTRTIVKRLDTPAERAEELARMLGGRESGETALRHAEAMLRQAVAPAGKRHRKGAT